MKRIVIGFTGDKNTGKTLAAKVLKKKGFHRVSIHSKIQEFAHHLFSSNEIGENKDLIYKEIRERGQKVHKGYWINLVLISVPDTKNLIVFDDIGSDEASLSRIQTFQIYRPGVSVSRLPDIDTIVNDGTKKDFEEKIEQLYKKIMKSQS